ncbi:MAG: STAS-like domain-containing protein [gamma proteobacterium endosymbiont of Lamellibrachia anaximandri]|nr:STAS-like domain-containing protein [gamma proteobacterium endosymbiont of Lamellibrachia anaximandri]MBL3618889.1 STAS-like domain-containing protein [gamma proteobacterium endosymbiont of Lamellibrachia anaximandri]
MRTQLPLTSYAKGHLAGTRAAAAPLRLRAEEILSSGGDVVLNFRGVEATQSFIDELIGYLILSQGPSVLERIVFRHCSENLRAIIEYVAADRCDQYLKRPTHH